MSRPFLLAALVMASLALALVDDSNRAAAQKVRHPRLHHALYELRHARTEMEEAKGNFGGHRDRAIEALDFANEQLRAALDFAR
jgi:hypothetical protein